MRILALSPFDPSGISGNGTTLRRLREGFSARGHGFRIVPVTAHTTVPELRSISAGCDLILYYHAYKTGRFLPALTHRPSVVVLSGTDLNECIDDPGHAPAVRAALAGATRLVTYNPSLAARLMEYLPRAASKLTVLPKGVTLGTAGFDLRGAAGLPPGRPVLFHPGGVRPVKNNLFAIDALAPLRDRLALVFAGPIHDPQYGATFSTRVAAEPWTRHLPNIAPDAMAAACRASDVVLNTSLSEGLSNALIEALAAGSAVLAAGVPGNRDLLGDGAAGLLYRDLGDLRAKTRRLLDHPAERASLGAAGREFALRRFSTDREVEALLSVCRRV